MPILIRQNLRMASYLAAQRLRGRTKFPLIVEVEPLFSCNLACAGCGKIQHPIEIMRKYLSPEEVVAAVEECGAPMVSLAGGEPLLHPQIDQIEPSPYLSFAVHIDGLRERHDESVCRDGVFDKAVAAIKEAKERGFRVTTNTTFFTHDSPKTVRDVLDFLNDELKVDAMMISPAYSYERAPDQEHFLPVEQSRRLFAEAFSDGRRRKWRLNHTPLFLDFLEGKVDYECTAWGIPCYSVLGWQMPCYLMADGYVSTYAELVEKTDWERYGRGKDPRCDNCLAHCGYEPTAVMATTHSLTESLRAAVGH